jgi:3-isopropylmalate dehydrogenase
MEKARSADAILLGAMGLPDVRWGTGTEMAPQLDFREQLELYAGVRPIYLYNAQHSPLRAHKAGEIDFVIFRENTEGLFFSRRETFHPDAFEVRDTMRVSRYASERLFRAAFRAAEKRRKHLTLVDKANVLPSMAYFRRIFDEIAEEFPDVRTERVYVDAAALYLVRSPQRFDVMVTENMFGDILSDLAAGLVGGMGMAPSGDIGDGHAVFQPSHGSAPDIAGKGIANPIATILSVAMMLEWFSRAPLVTEPRASASGFCTSVMAGAQAIRRAVTTVCGDAANATPDLGGALGTDAMTERILEAL